MTGFAIPINTWDDLPRAIAQLRLAGQHHRVVLLSALYRGDIAHVEIQRETPAEMVQQFCTKVSRPALILIGDDDDAPTGPDGWPDARRVLDWANFVVIHAAAGRVEEYENAVVAAQLFGRVLLIETSTDKLTAWADAATNAKHGAIVSIIVPARGAHPIPQDRRKMQ